MKAGNWLCLELWAACGLPLLLSSVTWQAGCHGDHRHPRNLGSLVSTWHRATTQGMAGSPLGRLDVDFTLRTSLLSSLLSPELMEQTCLSRPQWVPNPQEGNASAHFLRPAGQAGASVYTPTDRLGVEDYGRDICRPDSTQGDPAQLAGHLEHPNCSC